MPHCSVSSIKETICEAISELNDVTTCMNNGTNSQAIYPNDSSLKQCTVDRRLGLDARLLSSEHILLALVHHHIV